MEEIINCAAYADGRRVSNIMIDDISEVLKMEDRFVWIGLHEPGAEMLRAIQREFNLHDLAIEDAHRAHQRPKLETYGDSIFIVMRTAQMNKTQQRIELGETHFFLGKNFIISVRHGSTLSYKSVRTRCESTPHLLGKGPGFALYAVMDAIVDQFFPVVDELEQKLESLEEKIFGKKLVRETTEDIFILKRDLMDIKRAVSPLIEICNRLLRYDSELIPEGTKPYFRDVCDHVIRINEMVDNARELLNSSLEANFSLISIAQNETSKKFAGWAAIFAVPTFIAGIYGMNFQTMPELQWRYGYPVILSMIFVVCFIIYLLFKRSGWL
jgi:magnesium transporter